MNAADKNRIGVPGRPRERGFIVSIEAMLVMIILGSGIALGMFAITEAVLAELTDVREAVETFLAGNDYTQLVNYQTPIGVQTTAATAESPGNSTKFGISYTLPTAE